MGTKENFMKSRYAVVNDSGIVEEVVESSDDSVENVLSFFFSNKKIVLETEKTGHASTQFYFINEKFIAPKPFESWNLVEGKWTPPLEHPNDGNFYQWNEKNKSWEIILFGD